jgi:predicted AlkP superfamily pyrophosphatase or phosphodiesterase
MSCGTRTSFCCLILGLIVTSVGRCSAAPVASPEDRIVVMISVDGLAAFYFDDPRAEMPTIRALTAGGAMARMKASVPTVTWPNHTTLVTGVTPARHGVLGNNYFDRAAGKPVALISDPDSDKDEIVKAPTVYDLAKERGLRTAAIRWPATRNAKTLDWTFPDVASDVLLRRYATPSLLTECEKAGIWADGEVVDSGRREVRIVSDVMCTDVFKFILHAHRPHLALLHIIHVDHVQHVNGPRSPEAYDAIKVADDQVRQVWEALKQDYADAATLIIVSDHGFSPIERLLLPNVVLRDAGLVEVQNGKVAGGAVRAVMQGGAAMIYVLDQKDRDATVERVKKAFADCEGIGGIVGPAQLKDHGLALPEQDPHAPDMLLFAKEGYGFIESAGPASAFIENPERKGNHGHDANLPNLYAAFVAWGCGIKPGTRLKEIQNTDVAPTIAHLLGLSFGPLDGQVLSTALSD